MRKRNGSTTAAPLARAFVTVVLAAVTFLACEDDNRSERNRTLGEGYAEGTGTIGRTNLEVVGYTIEADDGTLYHPVDLPQEFAVVGLRVYFVVAVLELGIGLPTPGTYVTVVVMRRL